MKKQLFIFLSMLGVSATYIAEMPAAAAQEECPVCLGERPLSQQVHFQCAHKFCEECFGQIYAGHHRASICPVCRTPLIGEQVGAAQGPDPDLEAVLRISQQDAAHLLDRLRVQEEDEAAQLAAVMADSLRLEQERLGRIAQQEARLLVQTRRLAEEQRQRREMEERRLRLQEEAEIAQALALSLQQPQAPVRRQAPAVAPRPRPVVVAPQDAPRSAQSGVVGLAKPSVAPRPGVVPVVQQRHQFPVAEERPMTVMERILAQQREAFERLEREKQGK